VANFEGLIRSAISAKRASSEQGRQEIYQSSRNALRRLIDENRSLTVEHAVKEQRSLEEAILRIEHEFTHPPEPEFQAQTAPVQPPDPLAELKEILLDDANDEQRATLTKSLQSPEEALAEEAVLSQAVAAVTPEPVHEAPSIEAGQSPDPTSTQEQATQQAYVEDAENMPLEFAKRRKTQKRLAWFIGTLVLLALLGWLAFYLYMGVVNGTLFGLNSKPQTSEPGTENSVNDARRYITIVEPGDLSSLITAGRGDAELVNELNVDMIRVTSVRADDDRSKAARPILLRLQPGVLDQISGKNVTFEIFAKSGTGSPAQFTVKCQFGALGSCGRKRFRVGLQPEASIFAFDFAKVSDLNQKAYIAISTDTTAEAEIIGKGDAVDIVYARLRPN